MTEHDVIWQPWDEFGLEHLHVTENENGATADSMLLRVYDSVPVRMRYVIRVDAAWRALEVNVDLWNPDHRNLSLRSDGQGAWRDEGGRPIEDAFGLHRRRSDRDGLYQHAADPSPGTAAGRVRHDRRGLHPGAGV